ncbi:MAG: 28S ribosomal protein S5, mitochondrial [Trizodia sp. TS-e1964]|nr:MAG: 28S ribosomal protein S5, mitochondrial [Trizodia sp. TS-e1964]
MNACGPARCLFSARSIPRKINSGPCRNLHCTAIRQERRRAKPPNIKAADMGLAAPEANPLTRYSDEEKKKLANRYNPEQLRAIEAGEDAIDPEDLLMQGKLRNDPFRLQYLDDLSVIRPVVDKKVQPPASNHDPDLRLKNEDEIVADLADFIENIPQDVLDRGDGRLEWMKFLDNRRLTVGKEEAERAPQDFLAPVLPKIDDPVMPKKVEDKNLPDEDMRQLMKQTGFTHDEIRALRTKNLVTHRVVNQTRMGKIQSQYCLCVAGNGNGLIGIGEGKSAEHLDAFKQAQRMAIRNMKPVLRYEERTIFGDVEGKVAASVVKLFARPPGEFLHLPNTLKEASKWLAQALAYGVNNISSKCVDALELPISPLECHDHEIQ